MIETVQTKSTTLLLRYSLSLALKVSLLELILKLLGKELKTIGPFTEIRLCQGLCYFLRVPNDLLA